MAFKKTFSYAGFEMQPKSYEKPKIALLNIELELKAEKDNAEVRVNNVEVGSLLRLYHPSPWLFGSKKQLKFFFFHLFLMILSCFNLILIVFVLKHSVPLCMLQRILDVGCG